VQSVLTKLDGVDSAKIDLKAGEVVVRFNPGKVRPGAMAKAVTGSGFVSRVKTPEN